MANNNPQTNQRSHLALYRNQDRSIHIGEFVTTIDEKAAESLRELARKMRTWDSKAVKRLEQEMSLAVPEPEMEFWEILCRYQNDVKKILALIGADELYISEDVYDIHREVRIDRLRSRNSPELYLKKKWPIPHGWWIYPNSISYINYYTVPIEEFEVDHQSVLAAISAMEKEEDRMNMLSMFEEALSLQRLLRPALEEYRQKFEEYVTTAEGLIPGIFENFEKWSYCRKLSESFGNAELDDIFTPGNQTIVDYVDEYICAYDLEKARLEFKDTDNGLLLASRYLGENHPDESVYIDEERGLSVLLNTDFGFGMSSDFNATLQYKGVSAINTHYVIFYRFAGMAQSKASTYRYEVNESAFLKCFERIRDINNEYLELGEAEFVDKYFKQSLKDLSELLFVIANTNSFLQVTTLEKLESLIGNETHQLVPVTNFEEINLDLTTNEKEMISELGERMLIYLENGEALAKGVDKAIDSLTGRLSESTIADSLLQRIVKLDLIRSKLVAELGRKDERSDYIVSVVNELLPEESGIQADTYTGYELIDFRAKTASRVLSLMERLTEIAKLVDFEEILMSFHSTIQQVCDQAKAYRKNEIAHRLAKLTPQEKEIEKQLNPLLEKKKKLGEASAETEKINKSIQELNKKLRLVSAEIYKLKTRDSRLESFIESVKKRDELNKTAQ